MAVIYELNAHPSFNAASRNTPSTRASAFGADYNEMMELERQEQIASAQAMRGLTQTHTAQVINLKP